MFQQGRAVLIWLSWLIGGIIGVIILLVIICYCRLMPRHQKSFDEQYIKETYSSKDRHAHNKHDSYRIKDAEAQLSRGTTRPASYAGGGAGAGLSSSHQARSYAHSQAHAHTHAEAHSHHRSSTNTLCDETADSAAMKTRSLPAFLRRARPLSADDQLQLLLDKVEVSKRQGSRMRSSHAALIALSKSQDRIPRTDATVVYSQRTAL